MNSLNVWKTSLSEAQATLDKFASDAAQIEKCVKFTEMMVTTVRAGGNLFSCGNGGSHCDAMHFAEEMTGRFRESRPGYAATAIADAGHLSCVANDFGFEQVFSRYIEAHGRAGDILLAISTSGTSPNVVAAARAAQAKSMKVIALTGREGAALSQHADLTICTPAGRFADRVQELHIKVIHILIELIEHHMAGSSKTAGGK